MWWFVSGTRWSTTSSWSWLWRRTSSAASSGWPTSWSRCTTSCRETLRHSCSSVNTYRQETQQTKILPKILEFSEFSILRAKQTQITFSLSLYFSFSDIETYQVKLPQWSNIPLGLCEALATVQYSMMCSSTGELWKHCENHDFAAKENSFSSVYLMWLGARLPGDPSSPWLPMTRPL